MFPSQPTSTISSWSSRRLGWESCRDSASHACNSSNGFPRRQERMIEKSSGWERGSWGQTSSTWTGTWRSCSHQWSEPPPTRNSPTSTHTAPSSTRSNGGLISSLPSSPKDIIRSCLLLSKPRRKRGRHSTNFQKSWLRGESFPQGSWRSMSSAPSVWSGSHSARMTTRVTSAWERDGRTTSTTSTQNCQTTSSCTDQRKTWWEDISTLIENKFEINWS